MAFAPRSRCPSSCWCRPELIVAQKRLRPSDRLLLAPTAVVRRNVCGRAHCGLSWIRGRSALFTDNETDAGMARLVPATLGAVPDGLPERTARFACRSAVGFCSHLFRSFALAAAEIVARSGSVTPFQLPALGDSARTHLERCSLWAISAINTGLTLYRALVAFAICRGSWRPRSGWRCRATLSPTGFSIRSSLSAFPCRRSHSCRSSFFGSASADVSRSPSSSSTPSFRSLRRPSSPSRASNAS